MVAVFRLGRKLHRFAVAAVAAATLVACDPVSLGGGGPSINTRKAVPVAMLLPQSSEGSGAALSTSFERAARLAMADLGEVELDLRIYDTQGTAAGAAVAAQTAADEGAKIILGPVLGEAAAAAGSAVASRNLNVLSFSNNTAIAGGNVFVLGSTFQNTADRLVSYATRTGKGNILIVHGDSPAEQAGHDAIARAIAINGGRLAGSATFPLTQQGVINAIPGISAQVRSSRPTSIFMTSGNDGAIPFLAELLPENGVDNEAYQFIGLQRLDIPSGALALDGLQGAWFALPDPGLTELFRSRYSASYGGAPHPLAGLAYDAVAAVGALVATGTSDALTAASLTRESGFAGVNGVFRLRPNGTNERALAIGEVQNKQVVLIDPAPRSFGSAGF